MCDFCENYVNCYNGYHHMKMLTTKYPILPIDYTGNCKHNVGALFTDGINCTICGYFIKKEIKDDQMS
jgi:hypothetical protein